METRPLDLADLDAAFDIRTRSFGPLSDTSQAQWKELAAADAGQLLGVYDGSRLAGVARYHRFGQWWHGQDIPMAGVAGVVVAPEHRGRGVGRLLMTSMLDLVAAERFPLSALYPQTAPLYRSLGWELAGVQPTVTIPGEALRTIPAAAVPLRRVGADDLPEIREIVRRVHAESRDCGPIEFPEHVLRYWMTKEPQFAYLAEDGYLEYNWNGAETLYVEYAVALSEQTSRALWALVGSGASVARTVRGAVAPHDPVRWMTREPAAVADRQRPWMLRIVNAPAAIAGRGFPVGVSASAVVAIDDPQLPGNAGPWQLEVSGGRGELTLTERDSPMRLTAGGFASLYAGTPVSSLRRAGLARDGDPERDALLDGAFAATTYCLDYF